MNKKYFVLPAFAAFVFFSLAGITDAQSRARKPPVKKPAVQKKPVVLPTGAVRTESGLIYLVTQKGTGALAKAGDIVTVHYTGTLTNGTKFDSSVERGKPIEFTLGIGKVIKGWDEGLSKLHVGDQAIFIIPSSIAYGPKGRGPIPPDATLIFIVELVDAKPPALPPTAPAGNKQ